MASPIITMLHLMTEAKTECRENHRSPIVPQTHPVMEGARVVEKMVQLVEGTWWTYSLDMCICKPNALYAICSLRKLSVCSWSLGGLLLKWCGQHVCRRHVWGLWSNVIQIVGHPGCRQVCSVQVDKLHQAFACPRTRESGRGTSFPQESLTCCLVSFHKFCLVHLCSHSWCFHPFAVKRQLGHAQIWKGHVQPHPLPPIHSARSRSVACYFYGTAVISHSNRRCPWPHQPKPESL